MLNDPAATQYAVHSRLCDDVPIAQLPLLLGATVRLGLMNLGAPPMVGAGRRPGSSGIRAVSQSVSQWKSGSPGSSGLAAMGGAPLRCSSLSTHPDTHPHFPARWDCQGSPGGKSCASCHFSLIFWGAQGLLLIWKATKPQHASIAAHTLEDTQRAAAVSEAQRSWTARWPLHSNFN